MKRRPFYFIILIALLISIAFTFAFPSMPAVAAQINPIIRVWLKRLQVTDSLRIDVQGTYALGDGSMLFSDGTELTIALRADQLVLHTGSVAITMGPCIELVRCEGEKNAALRLNHSDGLYEGDLYLSIQDDMIRPVLHIFVEDYLLGVVPYEMGDSFPLEALKAQAIAARTYALKKSSAASKEDYDVEDTTNDQAYKGRSSSSPLSEQAVLETRGLCGTYQDKLAWCYYSASNGGQTELGEHVWPTDDADAYAYMDMRDDPYDYENDASVVKRFTLQKEPGKKGIEAALHTAFVEALKEPLNALEHDCIDENLIRIDEILNVKAVSPRYDEPSRLMTALEFQLKISVRDYLYRDTSVSRQEDYEIMSDATPTPTPRPTATPAYSPYERLSYTFTVVLPIFTEAEQAMGLSINTKQNELISVFDIGSAFMIESRRFGHGVGMSQRGAEQMAGTYGMSYEEILSFYYPGMHIALCDIRRDPLAIVDTYLMSTPAPTPSPTPRPTFMPVSKDHVPKGVYLAVVSNIDENSSLNLREDPSLSSDVIRRLYKGQELIVLSKHGDGWVKVKTDVVEGYVRSEYLQKVEN